MTHAKVYLNGAVPRAHSSGTGRFWPVFIVVLLSLNAAIVGTTVYLAVSDRSAVTEPDYYAKALRYDGEIRQREINRHLGWRASSSLRPAQSGLSMELLVRLTDGEGWPLRDARVTAVVFASIRSGDRQSLILSPRSDGEYAAPIQVDRSGLWCVRLSVTRGDVEYTDQTEVLVPEPAR